MASNPNGRTWKAVGYTPAKGIPQEDYEDFRETRMSNNELLAGLAMGIYPPGLVLRKFSASYQVKGEYLKRQQIERIAPKAWKKNFK